MDFKNFYAYILTRIQNFSILKLTSFEEAAKGKIIEEKIKTIEKKQHLRVRDCLKDNDIIGVKQVFKTKLNRDGTIQKHKTSLVVKDYLQRVDYNKTFIRIFEKDCSSAA